MRPLAVAAGVLCVAGGAVLAVGYALTVAMGAADAAGAQAATTFGALALSALAMGAGLIGAGARRGPRWLPVPHGTQGGAMWLVAFVTVLGVGSAVLRQGGGLVEVALPPIHFLAALLPALAIVAVAAGRGIGEPASSIWATLAYGGCLAAAAALAIEAVAVMAVAAAVIAVLTLQGDVAPYVASLQAAVESAGAGVPPDVGALAQLWLRPVVLVAIVGMFGVIGPVAEELVKLGGVALRRPASRRRAWLLGVAVGAGFGVTEAITLGSMMLDAWAVSVLVRATAMLMHATATGLAGLGWHLAVVEGRRGGGLGLVVTAMAGHMLWNTLVMTSAATSLAAAAGGPPWLGGLAVAAVAGLVALFAAVLLTFRGVSRTLSPGGSLAPEPASEGP